MHRRLPAARVPRQLSCSASGVKCMGIYIFSRAICFVSRLRCVGSRVFPAGPRNPWSLPSLRQPCLQVLPRILEGTPKKRRLSKKFSACLIYWTCPAFLPSQKPQVSWSLLNQVLCGWCARMSTEVLRLVPDEHRPLFFPLVATSAASCLVCLCVGGRLANLVPVVLSVPHWLHISAPVFCFMVAIY